MTAPSIRLVEIVCVAAMSLAALASTFAASTPATPSLVVCCLPALA